MRRRAIALLFACGCTAPENRWLDYPPSEGAKSLIVAAELDGTIVRAEAYALDPRPASLRLGVALGAGARLHGLVYQRSLEELGIDPGPIESLPAPEGRPLPEPDAAYTTRIEDDFTSWSLEGETSPLDRFTARYRMIVLPPCTVFVSRIMTVTSTSEWRFSANIDDRSVLVGSDAGELFVVTATSIDPIQVRPPDFFADTAIRDPAGGLIFAAGRAIWRGRVVPPSTLIAEPLMTTDRLRVLAGRTEPLELFGITRERRFIRLDGGGATELYAFNPLQDELGIATITPGDAVAAGEPDAVHYRSGTVEREATPFSADSLITAADVSGYVAATSLGQVVRYREGSWESLGDTGFALPIRRIAPYPRGFVYGGANGGFGQYVEGRGFCEAEAAVAGVILGLHPIGEKVIVVQKYLANGIAILEPQ